MTPKWRPPLVLVLGGALAATLVFSLIGLILLRQFGPQFGYWSMAWVLAALIGLATAILGLLLVRLLLGPIRALMRYAEAVRAGPGAEPPARFGTSEIWAMARTVVDMAETLKTRESTIRSFSDHVTHEIKSPASAIAAAAELLQDSDGLSAEDRALLDQIEGAARQIHGQLDALRQMARAREADYHGTTTLSALAPEHAALTLEISGGDIELPLAREGLKLILDQLLANARAHGARAVRLVATPGRLRIEDDGDGISAGNRDRIFDPFFTTRRATGGTGMGLSIVAAILRAHGAEIAALPGDGGAVFELRFRGQPAVRPKAHPTGDG